MISRRYVLYYSHNALPIEMEEYFQRQLLEATRSIPLVSVMKKARSEWSRTFANENVLTDFQPNNWSSILHQISLGIDFILQTGDAVVYLAEHDVLYPPSYFANVPEQREILLKNKQLYFMNRTGYIGPYNHYIHSQTIGWASLFKHCLLEDVHPDLKFKSKNGYELRLYDNEEPSVDVRHSFNYTGYREASSPEKYRQHLPHWGEHATLAAQIPGFLRDGNGNRTTYFV